MNETNLNRIRNLETVSGKLDYITMLLQDVADDLTGSRNEKKLNLALELLQAAKLMTDTQTRLELCRNTTAA